MAVLKFFFRVWLSLLPVGIAAAFTGVVLDADWLEELGCWLVLIFAVIMLAFVFCVIWMGVL